MKVKQEKQEKGEEWRDKDSRVSQGRGELRADNEGVLWVSSGSDEGD